MRFDEAFSRTNDEGKHDCEKVIGLVRFTNL